MAALVGGAFNALASRAAPLVQPKSWLLVVSVGLAVEALRVDHANHILGLRLNDWISLIVFLSAAAVLYWRRRPADDPAVTPTV